MYDIIIVGLGPAGATLARLLNRNYKVLSIDRKNDKVSKCCGGLLSPDAQKILARFDLCLPKNVLVDPQIFSVRTIDAENNIERFYQRFYMNMDRSKFDNFLISLIPDNVTIYKDSICKNITKTNNEYEVEFVSNGERKVEIAKTVIGADGANSIVRNTFYKKNKIKKYVSIQEWYDNSDIVPFYSCIFDKSITDSYSWTISKDKNFIIGGAFPMENSDERFERLKQVAKDRGINFSKKVKREGCFVYINKGFNNIYTGKDGAYLIGEAAGMISPSSLEGISYAMESANILAKILNSNTKNVGKTYYINTLKIRIKLFLKVLKMPFMYNKFLRMLVMKTGVKTIKK